MKWSPFVSKAICYLLLAQILYSYRERMIELVIQYLMASSLVAKELFSLNFQRGDFSVRFNYSSFVRITRFLVLIPSSYALKRKRPLYGGEDHVPRHWLETFGHHACFQYSIPPLVYD